MSKIASLCAALLFVLAGAALASGGPDVRLDPAPIHRLDAESLQRGARNFVNYCLTCHTAKYMRYERLTDIGLTEKQIKENLMFGTDKIGSTMTIAMISAEAKNCVRHRSARPFRRVAHPRQRLALQLFPGVLSRRPDDHRLE